MEYSEIQNRRQSILALVQSSNILTIEDICQRLRLTDSTARRDIKWLESQNLIRRFHGGVSSLSNQYDTFDVRRRKNLDEKRELGKAVAEYVNDNDIIYIGSGSTMMQFSRALIARNDLNGPIIVTATLNVAMLFAGNSKFELIILGGNITKADETIESRMTIEQAATINYTKVFNGAMGISVKSGITQPTAMLTELERTLARNAREQYRVADHSKFNSIGPYTSCSIEEAGLIITDRHPAVEEEISKNEVYKDRVVMI